MNIYTTDKIRNVVLLGHGGSGKTSLTRGNGLSASGHYHPEWVRSADGNTVSDYGKEEQ